MAVRKVGRVTVLTPEGDLDPFALQELEDTCGVQLTFVENQFGPGAAGALSFNVMAAVAQYYSDNLRTEVLKGMDEKVRGVAFLIYWSWNGEAGSPRWGRIGKLLH